MERYFDRVAKEKLSHGTMEKSRRVKRIRSKPFWA